VANLPDPVLGFIGRQETVLGGAGDLTVQGFEQEAHVLGLGFGLDRAGRVVDRDRFALGHQRIQFGDPRLERCAGLVEVQQALVDVEFQAGQQQLECRSHQLAGEGLGDFTTATQPVIKLDHGALLFQFVVFHHMVHIANGDQYCDPGYYQQGDHEWCHRCDLFIGFAVECSD